MKWRTNCEAFWPVTKNIILGLERAYLLVPKTFWYRVLQVLRIWTSGIVHESRGVKGRDSESDEFLENISARILAFSTECVKVWSSFIKCGIDEVAAFFSVLTNDFLADFIIIKNFTIIKNNENLSSSMHSCADNPRGKL